VGAVYFYSSDKDLSKVFTTAAVTLLYSALLGGVVTQLLADFDRRRAQRAAQVEFITNVLADLKGVYDQVDRGRTLIKAHRSAKTYGDEMRGFIEARVKLQNVERALRTDERRTPILSARDEVAQMADYLRALLQEFEDEYKAISILQSVFEAKLKRALEPTPPREPSPEALPPNEPWEALVRLRRLTEFLKPVARDASDKTPATEYETQFLTPLDDASAVLREALQRQLSG